MHIPNLSSFFFTKDISLFDSEEENKMPSVMLNRNLIQVLFEMLQFTQMLLQVLLI